MSISGTIYRHARGCIDETGLAFQVDGFAYRERLQFISGST
jgi:hypothetical protein